MSFENLQVNLKDLFLRKFKHYTSMSQETPCWQAEVWIKNWPGEPLKLCEVSNSGTGGPDEVYPDTAFSVLNEVAKQLPSRFYRGTELPKDSEAVLSHLFVREECKRELVKKFASYYIMVEDGKVYQLKIKGPVEQVQQKYPMAKILNSMDFEEALTLYMKETCNEALSE